MEGRQGEILGPLLRIVVRHKPSPAAANKWTKLGPCVDWFLIIRLFQGVLQLAVPLAYSDVDREDAIGVDEDLKSPWKDLRVALIKCFGTPYM